MVPPRIDLRGLCREFPSADGATRVLHGIDLMIQPGEFVAITGRSGSGKSTLLGILSTLDRGYQGSCRIAEAEVRGLDDVALAVLRRRVFGYVFQDFGLIPVLTCAENIGLPAVYDGVPGALRRDLVEQLLADLGLSHRAFHYPETLSGGERQRVAIARALINEAPIIVADEPTGALDSGNAETVMNALGRLHAEGRTVVLVTHDIELAEHAGRIVTLADGRVASERPGKLARASAPPDSAPKQSRESGSAATFATRFFDAARMVLRALNRRRLQSALTILGIAIGAASVIALATVGEGARRQVVERIEALGSDLITISRGPPGVRGGERLVTSLVAADAKVLAGLSGVLAIAPEIDGVKIVKYRGGDFLVTITGTNEQFPQARDWAVEHGVFFGADAVQRHAQVAVLGATAARNLFGARAVAVGDFLLIDNAPYRVLGVMERKGVTTGPGHDRDNQIWVPHTTASTRLFSRHYIERLVLKAERGADVDVVVAEAASRIFARHRREDFSVNTLAEVIRAATKAQQTLDYFLTAIAAISLLVGGVGVMNIMLASINERIREIGIRMAVGASRRDILVQFVSEAVVLCMAGGAAGVVLGVAAVQVVSYWADIPATLTWIALMSAVASAVIVGLAFGVGPALRAAAIDPADAFRRAN
jgi:macrolide transport system ATP-binding/permease protein